MAGQQTPSWPPSGTMSFESFMTAALYDHRFGYYSKQIRTVGEQGDFATASTLSPSLAHAIASWALKRHRESAIPLRLIEIGAGDGSLAKNILQAMPWFSRLKCQYHIVESSEPLRKIQQDRLPKKVSWHPSPAEALLACGGEALIFHNELVDAFPVRIFEKTDNEWLELYVDLDAQSPKEFLSSPQNLPESTAFQIKCQTGQRIEVLEQYRKWMLEWLPLWKRGEMLTIDYGDTIDHLYHRRPRGTIRGYLFHQALSGLQLYQNPGRQDLTSDVNFTDLQHWGEAAELSTLSFQTQADFIRPHVGDSLEDRYLTNMAGPGKEFKVLIQKRKPHS